MNDTPRQINPDEQRAARGFTSGVRRTAAMIVLCMVAVIAATGFLAAFQASSEPEQVPAFNEETRIDAPALETDEFLWEQRAPEFSAPEVTAEPESESPEADLSETNSTETAAPEPHVSSPETTSETAKSGSDAPKSDEKPAKTADSSKNAPSADAKTSETADSSANAPSADAKTSETADSSANGSPENVASEKKPEKLLADELKLSYTIDEASIQSDITDYELKLAATVIQLEVMGDGSELYAFEDVPEKYMEMLGVAQCIRNRVMSSRFPDTVKDVILQKGQFSPASKLDLYTPTGSAMTAAKEVLLYGVTVFKSSYMYFCATAVCPTFEKYNAVCLVAKGDTYEKWTGHLTTFYAGN